MTGAETADVAEIERWFLGALDFAGTWWLKVVVAAANFAAPLTVCAERRG